MKIDNAMVTKYMYFSNSKHARNGILGIVSTFGFIMSVLKVIVGKGMLAHAYAYRLVGYEMSRGALSAAETPPTAERRHSSYWACERLAFM